jgi:APA family basic amino acid/polyamine antiporter
VIYLLVSFIAVVLVPPATLATSSGPLLEVVTAAGVRFPPKLFAVIALLAIGNTALINMIMASRLLYGMANEKIVPRAFGRVHATRKTPVVAIGFTVVISCALIASGTVRELAETTVLLLLIVFGAITTLVLASPLSGRAPRVYLVAAILVGIGVVLWGVNRLITGTKITEIDAENLVK